MRLCPMCLEPYQTELKHRTAPLKAHQVKRGFHRLIKNIKVRQKLYHSDCVTLEKGYKLILAWRIIGVAQQ